MQRRSPLVAFVLGLVLIVASWVWPMMVGGRRAWSSADARQLQDATTDYHQLKYQYHAALNDAKKKGPASAEGSSPMLADRGQYANTKDVVDRFAQAEEQYRTLTMKLEQAKSGGQDQAVLLRWIGIAVAAVGVLGYFANRSGGNS